MPRSRQKKKRKIGVNNAATDDESIIGENVPAKCLSMRVKSGTKMRNILGHALKKFPEYQSILWTAGGQGIGKAISCVEIFKRSHPGLHQMSKLQYRTENNEKNLPLVAEINILLSRNAMNSTQPGYQAPDDEGTFENLSDNKDASSDIKTILDFTAKTEFQSMGLRMGPKRPGQDINSGPPSKKKKNINTKSS